MYELFVILALIAALAVGFLGYRMKEQRWMNPTSRWVYFTPRVIRAISVVIAFLICIPIGNGLMDGRSVNIPLLVPIVGGALFLILYFIIDYARNNWHWFIAFFESSPGNNTITFLVAYAGIYGIVVGMWLSRFITISLPF